MKQERRTGAKHRMLSIQRQPLSEPAKKQSDHAGQGWCFFSDMAIDVIARSRSSCANVFFCPLGPVSTGSQYSSPHQTFEKILPLKGSACKNGMRSIVLSQVAMRQGGARRVQSTHLNIHGMFMDHSSWMPLGVRFLSMAMKSN